MSIKMDGNKFAKMTFSQLQAQIEAAQKESKPIDKFVKRQIELLEGSLDEFRSQAKEKGYDMNHPKVGEIEVRQYSAMKQLAQKIGLPVEKYDKLIKDVQVRVFGEENTKRFFGGK
ncbi:MAG: hypothetical protein NC191_04550 [Muribaculaceae bacterium]|nr:hypothetical protein [Muribaculaceae bacterium]